MSLSKYLQKQVLPPKYIIASIVDTNVKGVVMTSSPFFIPADLKAKCNASVPELHDIAYLVPI